jgi:hypothetical protein
MHVAYKRGSKGGIRGGMQQHPRIQHAATDGWKQHPRILMVSERF